MSIPKDQSLDHPNPAIPTRQHLIDAEVSGLLGSVFNTDGTTDIRLIQLDDDGKVLPAGVSSALRTLRGPIEGALALILIDLRLQSMILAQAHGIADDLEQLREELAA